MNELELSSDLQIIETEINWHKDNAGETIQYNVICFLHFFENRSQLRSGSRSIVFDHIFEQEKYLVGGNHGIYSS